MAMDSIAALQVTKSSRNMYAKNITPNPINMNDLCRFFGVKIDMKGYCRFFSSNVTNGGRSERFLLHWKYIR